MTAQTRATNRGRFEDGDRATGSNFADLMDSFVSIADTTVQALSSDLSAIKLIATTEVSSPQVNTTEVSASVVNANIVNAATVSASIANLGAVNTPLVSASVANVNLLNVQAVSASSGSFYGRLRVGSSAADLGDVICCRQVTVPANNTKVSTTLPNGADIVDITAFIQTPPGGSAQSTTHILVGTSAQDDRFLRITNVTAQGYYRQSTSARTSAWLSVSGANAAVIVHTTAASGAIASATSGRINIFYVKRQ